MSHVTDVKLKIRDLEALREAAEALGLELREGQTHYAWWGTYVGDSHAYGEHLPSEMGTCAHALRIKGDTPRNGSNGPWEIGVFKSKDGDGFGLAFDAYGTAGRRLSAAVGPNADRLRQEYAYALARRKAKADPKLRGFVATREQLTGGRVLLRLRKR
jgi:hypothetical protein